MSTTTLRWLALSAGIAAACTAGSCTVSSPHAATPGPIPLHGVLHVSEFHIDPGVVLTYDGDLTIESEGDIVIAGSLRGVARPAGDSAVRGADLRLVSPTLVLISGEVVGAPGRDGSLRPEALALLGPQAAAVRASLEDAEAALVAKLDAEGIAGIDLSILDAGRGGNVRAQAPSIVVNRVTAGRGGVGGPGRKGGAGGSAGGSDWLAYDAGNMTTGGAGGRGGHALKAVNDGAATAGGDGGGALEDSDSVPPKG